MWLDAIDVALSRLAALASPPADDADKNTSSLETHHQSSGEGGKEETGWGRRVLSSVRALSVSGQQHGTVFWKAGARERLERLGQLGPRDTTLVEVRATVGLLY